MGRDLENIIPQQGFAPCEDNDGIPHLGDLIQKVQARRRVQLALIGTQGCRGPAMDAVEVAVSGNFPGYQPQGVL
jgi:hypothetical protein